MEVARASLELLLFDGIDRDFARSIGHTPIHQGTKTTIRLTRDALQSTQLHDSLIMQSRMLLIKQKTCQLRKLLLAPRRINRRRKRKEAGEDTVNIPVENRIGQVVGKRDDSRRRIIANSLERTYFVIRSGKYSTKIPTNSPRGLEQIPRPAIIPQPLPIPQHFVLGCGGQCTDIREASDKTVEVIQALRHPRLLEDYLGNPNNIRV